MVVDLTVDRLLEMRGKPVYDRGGEKIGSIEDIYIDDETRKPEWLGLGTGFLGMSHAVVPLANADFHDDGIEVPYSRDEVKSAPKVGDDEDISPTQELELSRHYALHAQASSPPSGLASSAGPSDAGARESSADGPDSDVRKRREECGDRSHLHKFLDE